jgi:putative sterol carrier protein
MTIEDMISDVKEHIDLQQIEQYDGFIAIQVNLTTEPTGVFYVEVKDHHLSVEPYEYYDRNAAISVSTKNFLNIIHRQLDPVFAFTTGKLKLDGDPGKVLELLKFAKPRKK